MNENNSNSPEIEALRFRCKNNDKAAIAELFNKIWPRVKRDVKIWQLQYGGVNGVDADELTSAALEKTHRVLSDIPANYDPTRLSLESYVAMCAQNGMRDFLRSKKRRKGFLNEVDLSQKGSAEDMDGDSDGMLGILQARRGARGYHGNHQPVFHTPAKTSWDSEKIRQAVYEAMEHLPPETLHLYLDATHASYNELVINHALPLGTVKSQLHKVNVAARRIPQLLEEHLNIDDLSPAQQIALGDEIAHCISELMVEKLSRKKEWVGDHRKREISSSATATPAR